MSKTKKLKHHKRKHYKRRHSNRSFTKRRRIRREIQFIPGSKSVPIFSPPENKNNTPILDSHLKNDVSIIPGLRKYLHLRS